MTDDNRPATYWANIRTLAIGGDLDLALATHLEAERRRWSRWYPIDESWRLSEPYESAIAEFDREVAIAAVPARTARRRRSRQSAA